MSWYFLSDVSEDGTEVSLWLTDEIGGWGLRADEVIDDLRTKAASASRITVSINSPGGFVDQAMSIAQFLVAHPAEITTRVLGVAASAATLIFAAGDRREMPAGTLLMFHSPSVFAGGQSDDLRRAADNLDAIGEAAVAFISKRTGLDDERVRQLMTVETYVSSAEAVDLGLTTAAGQQVAEAQAFALPGEHETTAALASLAGASRSEWARGQVRMLANVITGGDDPAPDDDGGENAPAAGDGLEEDPTGTAQSTDPSASDGPDSLDAATDIARRCEEAGVPHLTATMLGERLTVDDARKRIASAVAVRDVRSQAERLGVRLPDAEITAAERAGDVEGLRRRVMSAAAAAAEQAPTSSLQPADQRAAAVADDLRFENIIARHRARAGHRPAQQGD